MPLTIVGEIEVGFEIGIKLGDTVRGEVELDEAKEGAIVVLTTIGDQVTGAALLGDAVARLLVGKIVVG